jgi:antitoxin HigA-1
MNHISAPSSEELLDNPHPGILLKEDFLDEMRISPYRLAKSTGLTPIHVSELLKGKRNITPATALLLGKYFGTSAEYWINMQTRHDLIRAERTMAQKLSRVEPFAGVSNS